MLRMFDYDGNPTTWQKRTPRFSRSEASESDFLDQSDGKLDYFDQRGKVSYFDQSCLNDFSGHAIKESSRGSENIVDKIAEHSKNE